MGDASREGSDHSRVTLGDVAGAARVSKATASLVLNGRPGVGKRTRERVLAVAQELGYAQHRPISVGRAAATGTIGAVLTPTMPVPEMPNYYVAELLAGAEAEARARGYQLQVIALEVAAVRPPSYGGVAGVMFLGGSFPIEVLLQTDVPSILVGTFFPQWPYDAVLADNSRGAYLAVRHLLERGRRSVAFINGPSTTRTSELKMLGYREAVQEFGLEVDPAHVRAGDFTVDSGFQAVHHLFGGGARTSRPDALFVADDPMAVGALHGLRELGLSVPGDVGVVGYGDSPMGAASMPTLSTVRVFQHRMGMFGARSLIARLSGETDECHRILVGPELVVRESSAR